MSIHKWHVLHGPDSIDIIEEVLFWVLIGTISAFIAVMIGRIIVPTNQNITHHSTLAFILDILFISVPNSAVISGFGAALGWVLRFQKQIRLRIELGTNILIIFYLIYATQSGLREKEKEDLIQHELAKQQIGDTDLDL